MLVLFRFNIVNCYKKKVHKISRNGKKKSSFILEKYLPKNILRTKFNISIKSVFFPLEHIMNCNISNKEIHDIFSNFNIFKI